MKLLIASWGAFERWTETKYRFGNVRLANKSTLPILQRVIEPDWSVIVLPETLGVDFTSLEALRESIRGKVEEFLEEIGTGREVDVLIVPGIGSFSNGTFSGSALDTYHYVLYRLSQIIPPKGELEVHFDITHGLNYVTFLIHRALRELLGIRALLNRTRFLAYNSDPFVPGITRELGINVIEDVYVEPLPLSEPLPDLSNYLVPYSIEKKVLGELKRKLKTFDIIRDKKRKIDAWIGSVVFGLPLLFAENFPDGGAIEEAVEELLRTWEENVEVSEKRVERKLALGTGFGTLVKLLFQVKVLEGLRPELPPSVDALYELSNSLFRGSIRERVNVELHKVEEKAAEYASSGQFPGWTLLREFYRFDEANASITPRNFFAHAGLEANSTEVRMEEWDVGDAIREARLHTFLRYSPDAKKEIEAMVSRALGEGK
ncbi:CRISPR-associated protein DxTHG [Thermococcus sp. 2319x1]|nr:CRISPR-associated CARF protein Csx1 [Thermococcus sp. 2319x1]ALV63516.1 CRISPR-associated protein DxTHG [Thermococcus sp. 2319x1]